MKIDVHQHFWRYRDREYPWMGAGMDVLRRDYLPAEFRRLMQSAGFEGSVAVQARQVPEETAWLLELADAHSFIKGVVGWVDLCSADLRSQLERYASHRALRGVRHVVHDEPDDLFMLREDFMAGIGQLAGFDLVYELLLFPRHLPTARRLVECFPDQRFVLDHIGKPPIRKKLPEPWATDIRTLAGLPNVFCKVSGMVTEADWEAWKVEGLTPYLDVVFEAFGTPRLMVGSDWPVCTVAAPYSRVMAVVTDYLGRFSQAEQEMVLEGNARRIYGLRPQKNGLPLGR
jgi:L-fuconolactonase